MNNFIAFDNFTIAQDRLNQYIEAQADSIAPDPKPTHIPQRKARYSDRARVRRQDVRGWGATFAEGSFPPQSWLCYIALGRLTPRKSVQHSKS